MPEHRFAWHPTSDADDLDECLAIQPANAGGGLIGLAAARRIWRQLLHHPALLSAVVTCDPPIACDSKPGDRIAAFGAAVFVTAEFLDAEIANPRPYVNDRLMAELAAGRKTVLDAEAIAEANATTGLNVLSMYGSFRAAHETILSMLPGSFIELAAGYNIRRLLWEPVGEAERRFARDAGVHRFLAQFPDLDRDVVILDPDSAAQVPASLAPLMFAARRPQLGLARPDRELLTAAVKGLTDAELARALDVQIPAVKGRWRSIFSRIAVTMPELIEDMSSKTARGPQKRHRIVDYMRTHPEELRPWPEGRGSAQAIF